MGISRREFLYEIEFWEVRRILKGYGLRHREMWSATRWHAFNVMATIPYNVLKKNGITSADRLLEFPWDKSKVIIDKKEQQRLQNLIRLENEKKEHP